MKKIFLFLLIAVSLGFTFNQEFDFVQNYTRNFGSDFTIRSFTDKGYVDSARNKARDSVVTLQSAFKTITAYNSDTTAKTWDWADITGRPTITDAPTLTKSFSIPPTSASDNYTLFYTPVAITITDVYDVFQGTTPSYTYDIHFAADRSAAGTELFGTDRTATSLTSDDTQTFSDATIPPGWVWLKASATSGTVLEFAITIIYTED